MLESLHCEEVECKGIGCSAAGGGWGRGARLVCECYGDYWHSSVWNTIIV